MRSPPRHSDHSDLDGLRVWGILGIDIAGSGDSQTQLYETFSHLKGDN